MNKFVRIAKVKELTGVSRTTLYERIKNGLFTQPVNIGRRSVAWPLHEVIVLNRLVLAGCGEDELRRNVINLEKLRKDYSYNPWMDSMNP